MQVEVAESSGQVATLRRRGSLKLFLGYAPGVGKTASMLETARQKEATAGDVLIWPGSGPTEAAGAGANRLAWPGRLEDGRDGMGSELDLDGILARGPALVLVDDLAQANRPGSRHAHRYQDVLELLNAGISVYATLDILHLESLNDIVKQITGITVDDTIPDHVLDEADEVELIDLSVAELQRRFAEGRVNLRQMSESVAQKLFRPGSLAGLRELALRRTAEQVDHQMRAYMQTHAISGPWPATERILVCIGPSPLSERLVRTGRRLANRLSAEWFAVYVEAPGEGGLSDEQRDQVARSLQLAEALGAQSARVPAASVAEGIVDYAQKHNVTKVIAGKPLQSRCRTLLQGSVVDQIIRESHDIDVYVISSAAPRARTNSKPSLSTRVRGWQPYFYAASLVALATLIGLPLRSHIEPTNLVMLYLLAAVLAAFQLGKGPAVLASLLGVVAFDLIFVPPYYTFGVADAEYLLTLAALLTVSLAVSTVAARAREQAQRARRREMQTLALFELSHDLAIAADLEQVVSTIVTHLEQLSGGKAAVLLQSQQGLEWAISSPGFSMAASELQTAEWAFAQHQVAGRHTDTLAEAVGFYLPLQAGEEVVGVLGVSFGHEHEQLVPEQRRLLESMASQAALAVERAQLAERARQAQLLAETEKLQTALLNSISHDLRTPLASITGTLTSLRDDADLLDETAQQALLDTACEESERLNRLVGNLLDMTRLQAGALRMVVEPSDMQDAIGVAISQLADRLQARTLAIDVPYDLPLVPMDFVLIVQVLVNLLDNADKYSPGDETIEVHAAAREGEMVVEVADRGTGIPVAELDRVFDKFYRVQRPGGASGTGLGLSISKGIIEAHNGRIWARQRNGGGTIVVFALPLWDATTAQEETT